MELNIYLLTDLKGELTIKNRTLFFKIKLYNYYQKVTNRKKIQTF